VVAMTENPSGYRFDFYVNARTQIRENDVIGPWDQDLDFVPTYRFSPKNPEDLSELKEAEFRLGTFLRNVVIGPYYVFEDFRPVGGEKFCTTALGILLFHPFDRKNFVKRFSKFNWIYIPHSRKHNLKMLKFRRGFGGFIYDSPRLNDLVQALPSSIKKLQSIESAMQRVWSAPITPSFSVEGLQPNASPA
jgi:hypothetical protein